MLQYFTIDLKIGATERMSTQISYLHYPINLNEILFVMIKGPVLIFNDAGGGLTIPGLDRVDEAFMLREIDKLPLSIVFHAWKIVKTLL